jgi:hypothetical protein
MREYYKTDNLFKRNPAKKSELIIGKYTRPEFAIINSWDVTEKVDGTNVRLVFHRVFNGSYDIYGRTDNAQFTFTQEDYLENYCDMIRSKVLELLNGHNIDTLTIYGELYGPKIQSGGNYSDSIHFRAFDMLVNNNVWLAPDSVRENTKFLGVDDVPFLGVMLTEDIVSMVADGFKSTFAKNRDYVAEGVIAKPIYNLYDQRGNRVVFKLKHEDLKNAELHKH